MAAAALPLLGQERVFGANGSRALLVHAHPRFKACLASVRSTAVRVVADEHRHRLG
jgi:hypothetical protein